MTTAQVERSMPYPSRSGVQGTAPELCRLTILSRHTQVDLALPLGIPVALLIPGIVDMIESHSTANDFDESPERLEPDTWALARLGHSPLSSSLSLDEHGIRDGELLILESAAASAPPPLFDDIMHNVAVADTDSLRKWTPRTARIMGSALGVAATVVASAGLLRADAESVHRLGAGSALVTMFVFLIAGTALSRIYADRATAVVLGGCALPPAFVAGILMVPGERAAPHLLLGLTLTGAVAVLALRLSAVGPTLFTATAAIALFGSGAALVGTVTAVPTPAIGAGLIAAALVGLACAARISMLLAKLPLPPVPAPGTSLDPAENDPDDGVTMLSFTSLQLRAGRARRYLTGLVWAMTLLTATGALLAARVMSTDGIHWVGTALAVAAAAVLMFRGRTYLGADQAVPLVAGGAAIVLLLLIGAALTSPAHSMAVFGLSLGFAVAALVLGIAAAGRTFSPVLRRAVELLDYAAIVTIIPLVCWVAGLYAAVRGL